MPVVLRAGGGCAGNGYGVGGPPLMLSVMLDMSFNSPPFRGLFQTAGSSLLTVVHGEDRLGDRTSGQEARRQDRLVPAR